MTENRAEQLTGDSAYQFSRDLRRKPMHVLKHEDCAAWHHSAQHPEVNSRDGRDARH
jgi:hypothetical protein